MSAVPPPRANTRLLLGLVVWLVFWGFLGTISFLEVRALASLSDTMDYAGQSLDEAGQTLGALASIPLIGSGIRPAAERVQELAASTTREANASRTHITRLSVLAALMGGVIPMGLGVAFYCGARRRMALPEG